MRVLLNKSQIKIARRALIGKGASSLAPSFRFLLRRFGLNRGFLLGDFIKSWDVLKSLEYIENHVQKDEPILDIGCHSSEVIVALHKLGYSNLTGADLNPALNEMPYQSSIRYEVTNFMKTGFADCSFKAITSISVIEHGFDGHALLKEMSRLLKPGGHFIASFDYWPEKIDTTNIKFYGMDWKIFSKAEVIDFVKLASDYGLRHVGEMNFDGQERPIRCGGKKYTFGWLVLTKETNQSDSSQTISHKPPELLTDDQRA